MNVNHTLEDVADERRNKHVVQIEIFIAEYIVETPTRAVRCEDGDTVGIHGGTNERNYIFMPHLTQYEKIERGEEGGEFFRKSISYQTKGGTKALTQHSIQDIDEETPKRNVWEDFFYMEPNLTHLLQFLPYCACYIDAPFVYPLHSHDISTVETYMN